MRRCSARTTGGTGTQGRASATAGSTTGATRRTSMRLRSFPTERASPGSRSRSSSWSGSRIPGSPTRSSLRHIPELRPAALIIVDTFLDLPARYEALPPTHITRQEITSVLGGTLADKPAAYAERSPSHHLDGLATAIRGGMTFVDVWSVAAEERREFVGATCSRSANAQWLSDLANRLGGPVDGYVTQLGHARALWNHGPSLLALTGLGASTQPLPARRIRFLPTAPVPAASYCADQLHHTPSGDAYGQLGS